MDVTTSITRENKKKNKDEEEVNLWVITPTLSDKILNSFQAKKNENWSEGIYFLAKSLSLGKGKVQELAIEELNALPKDNPYRDSILELVSNLFTMLQLNQQKRQKLTKEDQELIMKLSPIYKARLDEREQIGLQKGIQQGVEQGIQQGLQQGLQQGIQQEATLLIVRQLKRKVGELSPNLEATVMGLPVNVLEDLGEALLDFNSVDDLTNWLDKGQS